MLLKNDLLGWHRAFQQTCGHLFPNIYRFIECLKKQQAIHNFDIAQLVRGQPVNQRNKKYAAISARVRTIVADAENRTVIDVLRGISYNFDF